MLAQPSFHTKYSYRTNVSKPRTCCPVNLSVCDWAFIAFLFILTQNRIHPQLDVNDNQWLNLKTCPWDPTLLDCFVCVKNDCIWFDYFQIQFSKGKCKFSRVQPIQSPRWTQSAESWRTTASVMSSATSSPTWILPLFRELLWCQGKNNLKLCFGYLLWKLKI